MWSFLIGSIFLLIQKKGRTTSLQRKFYEGTLAWILVIIVSAIPFILSSTQISYVDALFESASGVTTTGATVLSNLQEKPQSILLWRCILNAVGGLGVLIISAALLSIIGVNNIERNKSQRKTILIIGIYVSIITACSICFKMAGMSWFDAICHALSTSSTAGFANYDNSFAHFNSYKIELIAIIFMILGSLPFTAYIRLLSGKIREFIKNEQIRLFFIIVLSFSALAAYGVYLYSWDIEKTVRYSLFNIVSVITTTGFSNTDYTLWNIGIIELTILFSMFIGGCANSTTGGIKMLRILILSKNLKAHISRLLHKNKSQTIIVNGKEVKEGMLESVTAFFFLYIMLLILFSILMGITGLDLVTSISAAAAALTNTGPGLGIIVGPAGNYFSLPISSKLFFIIAMIIGRLELFTVLIFVILITNEDTAPLSKNHPKSK